MKKLIKEIINDTLKQEGKWSRTSLTMACAWFCVLFAFFYDIFSNGFNELTFAEMMAVAVGIRWVAAKSQ